MKNVLFINSCPRGEASRTLRLARCFLSELTALRPDLTITERKLDDGRLQPISLPMLNKRDALCDALVFDDELFEAARELHAADLLVIAAPYWDLSFPSELKVWVENIYIRNLCFHYEGSQCIGMCHGQNTVYFTTSGSPIGSNDFGSSYMQAVLASLGCGSFTTITAEGLDLWENNPEQIMLEAESKARMAAASAAEAL